MLLIAWTTLPDRAAAEALGRGAVEAGLAACAQVDHPVTSIYRWQGAMETGVEARLWLKFLPEQSAALEAWVGRHHPYGTPQWIVVRAERVAEKYLSWAQAGRLPPPL